MKNVPIAAVLPLSILLAGCNTEPEEAPGLEEAIPLDNPDDAAAGNGDAEIGPDEDSSLDASGDYGPGQNPFAGESPDGSTMQRGSNADSGRAVDPTRTKLVPAD